MQPMSKAVAMLEAARELSQPGQYNRQKQIALEGEYRVLSQDEARELGRLAVPLLDSGNEKDRDTAEGIFVSLSCLIPGSLADLHEALVEREVFYPEEIFLGADAQSRDALIHRVAWDEQNRNHLLTALAWIGDAAVQQQFRLWRDAPPLWRDKLYIPPEAYAQQAGWVLTAEGERRDLFFQTCDTLVRLPETESAPAGNPVTVIEAFPEKCRWCEWEMTTLFDFALASPQLNFLNLQGERLRVVMCDRCSGFTNIFMDVDTNGESAWAEGNVRPEFIGWERDDYERLPVNRMILGRKRRTPYEAHWRVLEEGHSQVGGHPAWIQDAEYPRCPGCEELMTFIAQLQTDDLDDYDEGTNFAFYCGRCSKATTVYQQT